MPNELIGFLPGSFDPPTRGHLDIILRAHQIINKLYIGITQNPSKKNSLFSPQERKELLHVLIQKSEGIEIVLFEGLAIDAAIAVGARCLVRGIRSASDAEYEFRMAVANRKVGELDTVFLMTDERYSHISSTLIRELGVGGKDLTAFVPPSITPTICSRLKQTAS